MNNSHILDEEISDNRKKIATWIICLGSSILILITPALYRFDINIYIPAVVMTFFFVVFIYGYFRVLIGFRKDAIFKSMLIFIFNTVLGVFNILFCKFTWEMVVNY
jgi:hypothetical protein